MNVYFKTKRLQKQCSFEKEMEKAFGHEMSLKLKQRLIELKAADFLSDISYLPPPRLHILENTEGIYSVDLKYPYRLLFFPAKDSIPMKNYEEPRNTITEIQIISIEDTHDGNSKRRGSK